MRKAHRLSAQVDQVVISVEDLAKGNLKGSRSRVIDRVYTHLDGKLTGKSLSVDNRKVDVTFRKELNCWVY